MGIDFRRQILTSKVGPHTKRVKRQEHILLFLIHFHINLCSWNLNKCLDIKISKCLASNYTNKSTFHPLEVVGRGSETQLQEGENLNLIN